MDLIIYLTLPINISSMRNVSTSGESLVLSADNSYLLIDALYLDDVAKIRDTIDPINSLFEIKEKVFPFTDMPFARYNPDETIFSIERILKINYEDAMPGDNSCFSSDTGLLILINVDILMSFLNLYSYEELVGGSLELLNLEYWTTLAANYKTDALGLILSPGIGHGFDFVGSGLYRVV